MKEIFNIALSLLQGQGPHSRAKKAEGPILWGCLWLLVLLWWWLLLVSRLLLLLLLLLLKGDLLLLLLL